MNEIVIASEVLRNWLSSGLEEKIKLHKFLMPTREGLNKAGIQFEKNDYLCSVSVWSAGTVEWIVVDGRTGKDHEFEDSEFTNEDDLLKKLEDIESKIERLIRI